MKRNAMKLTFKVCLFGGNSLAAKQRPLVKQPKLIPFKILFDYLSKNIFVLYRYA